MTQTKTVEAKSEQTLMPSDFVHLHNHTHHSLLDGLTKIPDLVRKSKEMGMTAAAITDHGTMSGAIEYYQEAKSQNFKPLIGIETYMAARTRHDRDPAKDKLRYHLILIAMNDQGYSNLMKLSTLANLEGVYYKPRMDYELLEQYNEGIIALSGCASSEVGVALRDGDKLKAIEIAKRYKQIFGDRYYLELQDSGHPKAPATWAVQTQINQSLMQISKELDIPAVVTADGHYLEHSHQEAHEILLCVGTGSFISDEKRMSLKDFELHLTDPRDIISRWGQQNPEVILNTKKIADRCDVNIELGKILIPTFPVPGGENEKTYLDKLVYKGLANRYLQLDKKAIDELSNQSIRELLPEDKVARVDMEFGVLERMGYNGYFLIVQDFINWGKDRGIIFGPGRGSAAGSIIAYALNITDLDPLKYDLLFERFLNPDRISMPDIDIDIQDTRRDEVIRYCAEKYGKEKVANIVTFGKMAARAAVKDVARVLQVPYAESDRLSKMIPPPIQGRHTPLAKMIVEDADLKTEYENNPTSRQVIDYAITLEGTIRSHGVHAAGVVIAPDDIVKYVPLEMAQKGVVATQYPMGPVEDLGLLKMDFLGLSNLTIINNAMRIIKKVYKVDIDLASLELDDTAAYELLQRGDTTGVFQLESAGMKRYLRMLKPTQFEDIIAMGALYRPGPMQFIESFIARKHGEEEIVYLHEGLRPSLESTYGILVYQEQFMKISKDWCGFTGGQADTLRKAVGKKKIDLMKKVKPEFVEGAIKVGGASREVAEKFWDQLEEFANYSFNKSHAACYGLVSYWTAYLKAHYPDAFMAALMTSDQDDTDRLAIEMTECRHMNLAVLSPDVNESFVEFAVVPDKSQIRFGMAAVKGVGVGAVEEILQARNEARFTSIEDFASRVSSSKVNRKALESLIKTGAFDQLGNRSDLLFSIDNIVSFSSRLNKERLSGQSDLFGNLIDKSSVTAHIDIQSAPTAYTQKEQSLWERELLGHYISAHPLDNYDKFFEEQTVPLRNISPNIDGQKLTIGGLISTVRTIVAKSGKKMAFVGIEDKTAESEIIVFPNLYETIGNSLNQDTVIKITGKISARDRDGKLGDEAKMIADEIEVVSDKQLDDYASTGRAMKVPDKRAPYRRKVSASASASKPGKEPGITATPAIKQTLYLRVDDPTNTDVLLALKSTCSDFPGESEVILVLGENKKALRMPFRVSIEQHLSDRLHLAIGEESVVIK